MQREYGVLQYTEAVLRPAAKSGS